MTGNGDDPAAGSGRRTFPALDRIAEEIAELEREREACSTRAARKPINRRLHHLREIKKGMAALGF